MADELTDVQRQNLELVGRMLEVGERAGLAGLAAEFNAFFDRDVEWVPRLVGFGERAFRGKEGFQQYIAEVTETVGELSFSGSEVRAVGDDRVLALGRVHVVGRKSGLPFEDEYAFLYRVEADRVVSAQAFLSHAQAEEAAADA
ncbi:MAG TPA: nuclear transport factor 2 family protein [Solirubrobacterales bacterium]|jgi:ketosteroid isomerase-like protein|nr:nuclear transport factor 2 family protein [Solirubrobacterales bacterium]